ncbi:asparagine synthase-related protein [Sorangium sp. So ce1667]
MRVEMSKLRRALARHYAATRAAVVRIELPRGTYAPSLVPARETPAPEAAPRGGITARAAGPVLAVLPFAGVTVASGPALRAPAAGEAAPPDHPGAPGARSRAFALGLTDRLGALFASSPWVSMVSRASSLEDAQARGARYVIEGSVRFVGQTVRVTANLHDAARGIQVWGSTYDRAAAVRGQLMSDVPVGAFLSGGLDSSLLCAIAAKQGQALPCFTVVERTTVDAGDVARARRLTEALDLAFHPVSYDHEGFAEQIGFSLASLESFVWMMDAPRFTPELLFKHELHRYAKTVVPDLKAMLLGQGADEFAGGYSTPRGAQVADWDGYAARLSPSPPAQLVARGVPEPMRALVRPEALAVEGRAGVGAPFHREMRRRLLSLQALNLWNEDRIAAVQGVEARVPYLDHRLVEHLAAIPPALHRELFWDKAIVRRAAAGFLPDEFVHAPKVPFWLSGDASSVHAIMVDCARRCFPAFLEAYLGQPDSLFSASALIAVYARTRSRAPGRVEAAKLLLACMTAAIFARLCRDLRRDALAIRPMGPPSPLGRASW